MVLWCDTGMHKMLFMKISIRSIIIAITTKVLRKFISKHTLSIVKLIFFNIFCENYKKNESPIRNKLLVSTKPRILGRLKNKKYRKKACFKKLPGEEGYPKTPLVNITKLFVFSANFSWFYWFRIGPWSLFKWRIWKNIGFEPKNIYFFIKLFCSNGGNGFSFIKKVKIARYVSQ